MESTSNPIKSIIDYQYLNQKYISQDRNTNTEKINNNRRYNKMLICLEIIYNPYECEVCLFCKDK